MVDPVALRRRLLVAVALISVCGLGVELVHAWAPDIGGDLGDALVQKLSLSYEANLPTWFSSSLLLACAVAAGSIAAARPPLHRHWWGITAVATWISLDEAAELHEHLGGHFGTTGLLYYDWVIPATAVVLALALVFVPFVRELAAPTRMRLVIAGALYVTGALVMDMPLGWWTENHGSDGLGYAAIDWVGETLELVGVSLALVALVRHRQDHV